MCPRHHNAQLGRVYCANNFGTAGALCVFRARRSCNADGAGNLRVCLIVGGCAAYAERRSLGYGDYVGFSCGELGQEAVRLMRMTATAASTSW